MMELKRYKAHRRGVRPLFVLLCLALLLALNQAEARSERRRYDDDDDDLDQDVMPGEMESYGARTSSDPVEAREADRRQS